MLNSSLAAALLAAAMAAAVLIHVGTAVVTAWRLRRGVKRQDLFASRPSVSIIIPIAAPEPLEMETAVSTFGIRYPDLELLFCAFEDDQPILATIRDRIRTSPDVRARVLVGRANISVNPKLDNIEKGWAAAEAEYIAVVDSNVAAPPDLVDRLFAVWDASTALSCSPPVGVRPSGFWAHVECAFLNTYQARWHLCADQAGAGFAHGKVMLLSRDLLLRHGGFRGLSREVAEDSAATKIARAAKLKVKLVERPFEELVGERMLQQVWRRHLRWAQLRRRTFPLIFLTESLATVATALAPGLALASLMGWSLAFTGLSIMTLWYGVEAALAWAVGWPWTLRSFGACLVRDAMSLAIWPIALVKNRYAWRGNLIDMRNQASLTACGEAQ